MRFIESCGLVLKRSGAEPFKHPGGTWTLSIRRGSQIYLFLVFVHIMHFKKNKKNPETTIVAPDYLHLL